MRRNLLPSCIAVFFALCLCLQSTYAQKVNLNFSNKPLKTVLESVTNQTGYTLAFSKEAVNLNELVTINVSDTDLKQVLSQILTPHHISYEVKDNKIFLTPSAAAKAAESKQVPKQNQPISGTVVDANGEPVIAATIVVAGTTIGTVTDIDGRYTLDVPQGSVLRFSYIGYVDQEFTITDQAKLDVTLRENTELLDEVIVVGYATQRKESLTGSLQSINSKKLKDITSPSVSNLLNGKAPGVHVSPGSGQPGQSGSIIIRGKSTISGSTDPLWVIDGVIVGSGPGSLNSADIESMTVLKDAASTAIYGSQGANGVIIITTKNPTNNKLSIALDTKWGATKINSGNLKMMNGAELYDYYSSFSNPEEVAFPRWKPELRNSNFSWWDVASHTGIIQDYNLSISGGSEQLRSLLSLGIYDETGAVKGYDYTRYSVNFKTDFRPYEWLSIKPSISASRIDIKDKQYSVSSMYSNLPWDSPYDDEGNLVGHYSNKWVNSNSTNYLYDLQWNHAKSMRNEFNGSFNFDIKLTEWLTFASVNSYRFIESGYNYYQDPQSSSAMGVRGRIYENENKNIRRYTNQVLRFNKIFKDKHIFSALLGYEFNDYKHKGISASGIGFVPGFEVLNVTSIPENVDGAIDEWAVQSVFTKLNYDYDNRYLVELSLRRDGASNFGTNKKYGNFFSISGGWNIHNEAFFTADWVNTLKIRASYGSVGNRPNALYPQYDLYSVSQHYNEISGALIAQKGDPDLTWEKAYTSGIGVDASFLDRIRLTVDLYEKNNNNLLYNVPVTGVIGLTNIYKNVGSVKNRGFEIILGADIIKQKDLLWSIDANLGLNRNKVEKLYGKKQEIIIGDGIGIAGSASRLLKPGLDSDSWFLPEWAGVDQKTGAPQWYKTVENANGEKTREITHKHAEADPVVMGSITPKFFGAFSTNLLWKDFDFNAVFGYSVGGKIYNYTRQEYDSDGAYSDRNQMNLQNGWNRWQKPGDVATHPIAAYNNRSGSNKLSSRYLEDGSYLKLRNVTFGYNFELPQFNIQNMRLYVSGENLLTFTKFSGVDPEIPTYEDRYGNRKMVGTASTIYPSTRKFLIGLNLTF